LTVISQDNNHLPIYIGVREYHGGLSTILTDYGFAPFTDRAKMVKHVVQWVRNPAPLLAPALENIREVVPTPFVFPEEPHSSEVRGRRQDATTAVVTRHPGG